MIDILIKSFNRPYYLDRCLFSIYEFVIDTDFNVTLMDDGTPKKYLDRIIEKYPNIIIEKSSNYISKSKLTSIGKEPIVNEIPIELWVSSSQKASDYFLLLEDDMWFTTKINLNNLTKILSLKNTFLTKFIWLGNLSIIQSNASVKEENVIFFNPKLPFKNPNLHWVFYKLNRFKLRKIFSLLNLYSEKKSLSYYSIYSVAGAVFKKEYFLELWNNQKKKVDESLQITNALKFLYKRKLSFNFSRTNKEFLKTGFISSATNKPHLINKCDMFTFNYFLNEMWFENTLDSLQNFPLDYSTCYIKKIITNNQSTINCNIWLTWTNEFKDSFRNFGCEID